MSTTEEKLRAIRNSIRVLEEMKKNPKTPQHQIEKIDECIAKGKKVLDEKLYKKN